MRMSSALLPRAFERVGRERKFTVLDLGSPTPQSVRFFNQFSCRVYFAGLLDEDGEEGLGTGLDFPDDVRFDVCLFWDVLNYLNGDNPRATSEGGDGTLGRRLPRSCLSGLFPSGSVRGFEVRDRIRRKARCYARHQRGAPRPYLEGSRSDALAVHERGRNVASGQPTGVAARQTSPLAATT